MVFGQWSYFGVEVSCGNPNGFLVFLLWLRTFKGNFWATFSLILFLALC